jgi:hypothetical protein
MGGACSDCTGKSDPQNEIINEDLNPQVMDGIDGVHNQKKQRLHL